ncbi:hypothetical protein AAG906_040565 [Vitis piasezkii]
MPSNEVKDRICNSFEQDNSSQGHLQSQAVGESWPVNYNQWVGNQRQIGEAINFNLKNFSTAIRFCGGDGIAGWLLGIVSDLKLSWPPPIATVPLGTGNNLLLSFGWGKKNPGTDSRSVESFLGQVKGQKK